mgnify:CR=1 FL=1
MSSRAGRGCGGDDDGCSTLPALAVAVALGAEVERGGATEEAAVVGAQAVAALLPPLLLRHGWPPAAVAIALALARSNRRRLQSGWMDVIGVDEIDDVGGGRGRREAAGEGVKKGRREAAERRRREGGIDLALVSRDGKGSRQRYDKQIERRSAAQLKPAYRPCVRNCAGVRGQWTRPPSATGRSVLRPAMRLGSGSGRGDEDRRAFGLLKAH